MIISNISNPAVDCKCSSTKPEIDVFTALLNCARYATTHKNSRLLHIYLFAQTSFAGMHHNKCLKHKA